MKTAKNGRFIEPINDRIGDPVYLIRQQAGQIPSAAFRCCLGVGNVLLVIFGSRGLQLELREPADTSCCGFLCAASSRFKTSATLASTLA